MEADCDSEADDSSFWNQLDENTSSEVADWSGNELEAAYLRAMEVLEAADAQIPELMSQITTEGVPPGVPMEAPVANGQNPDRIPSQDLTSELQRLARPDVQPRTNDQPSPVTPRQILEAVLFVGGDSFTTKRLSHVLRGEFTPDYIEAQIEELNALYSRQCRPYEIRFGDGGYRIVLRDDFEQIRRKVFGLGPKEVRLSQDVLEVLAVVAYNQPVTVETISELGKPDCGSILRQLLRRELICVERSGERQKEVLYRTTPRFLSLFGLRSLNELPRMEQINYK